ncbi:hypothetical protein BDV95DRAFT_77929 [Massariosphaeria phaeospora]|uniref:Uncharacterized protein n=1 Tax=Massariosphaeria phaeospora TaxID=100035 RepID=A0A7C8I3Y0_9PLEO|nr:hypothetical protein BDV95DRAFT_77929 [Massariosphaeria phaeospora]
MIYGSSLSTKHMSGVMGRICAHLISWLSIRFDWSTILAHPPFLLVSFCIAYCNLLDFIIAPDRFKPLTFRGLRLCLLAGLGWIRLGSGSAWGMIWLGVAWSVLAMAHTFPCRWIPSICLCC